MTHGQSAAEQAECEAPGAPSGHCVASDPDADLDAQLLEKQREATQAEIAELERQERYLQMMANVVAEMELEWRAGLQGVNSTMRRQLLRLRDRGEYWRFADPNYRPMSIADLRIQSQKILETARTDPKQQLRVHFKDGK
jgi:hypothetical protein